MADQPTARARIEAMVRTDRGSMTVWSPAEVRDALDAYEAEHRDHVLAEAAELLYAVNQDEHNISLCCRDCAMDSAAAVLLAARTTPTT